MASRLLALSDGAAEFVYFFVDVVPLNGGTRDCLFEGASGDCGWFASG